MPVRVSEKKLKARQHLALEEAHGGQERIVLVIAGIRTNAEWVGKVGSYLSEDVDREHLSQPSLEFKKALPSRISSFDLIFRTSLSKNRQIIKDQINSVFINHPNASVSVIAHSLGTDLFADCAKDLKVRFDNVILLGSVCKDSKLSNIYSVSENIYNLKSSYDKWPIIAGIINPLCYYPTGVFGFNKVSISEICFDTNHYTCTSLDFVKEAIIPLLNREEMIKKPSNKIIFDYNYFHYSRLAFWASIFVASLCGLFFQKSHVLLILFIPIMILLYYCFLPRDGD